MHTFKYSFDIIVYMQTDPEGALTVLLFFFFVFHIHLKGLRQKRERERKKESTLASYQVLWQVRA